MKKICMCCEIEYESKIKTSKFCSQKCRSKFNRLKNKNRNKNSTSLKWFKKVKAIESLGGKCKFCGDTNIYHLVFHHLDLNIKEENLAKLWSYRWSEIEKEIKKCIVLCDNCHRELHYNNNNFEERRKSKEIIVEYKGNKCEKCGYNKCLAALTFHHKDDKEFEISKISIRISNISELKNEIFDELNKCDLLCSNCHREEHANFDIESIKNKKYKEIQNKINRDDVFRLHFEQNLKINEIAKILKCSKSTISEIVKEIKKK